MFCGPWGGPCGCCSVGGGQSGHGQDLDWESVGTASDSTPSWYGAAPQGVGLGVEGKHHRKRSSALGAGFNIGAGS